MDDTYRVLLATDFSPASQNASRAAEKSAPNKPIELHVLLVHRINNVATEVDQSQFEQDRECLSEFDSKLEHDPVKTIECGVAAAPAITRYATHHEIDVIAVGTHARRGFHRFFLGSVAAEVLRTADTSVVVAGPDAEQPAANYHLILTAVDFSDPSLAALRQAAAIAHQHGARLIVMHVVDTTIMPSYAQIQVADSLDQRALDELNDCIDSAKLPITAEPEVALGAIHEEIVAASQAHEADLIVVAASGHGAVANLLLGSTADRVVRSSRVPVWVNRERCVVDAQ